jgi:predicted SnoaL-like aldol condensation-catalyzing enzyme
MKKAFLLLAVATTIMAACENQTGTAGTDEKTGDTTATAGTKTEDDKEERNKKVVMASMDAMKAKNVDEAFKDVASDATEYGDGSMKPVKGKDSIVNMVKQWMNAFPDVKGEDLKYVADGDWVMVWGEWSGTFKNDFAGMKATNKSFKLKDVDIFKLNDAGQIVEHHNVQSPNTMFAQLGVKPPPATQKQ